MKFVIVKVEATSYEPSPKRESLQLICDDLNRDAIEELERERWITVPETLTIDFLSQAFDD
jgi:hypothetical protein